MNYNADLDKFSPEGDEYSTILITPRSIDEYNRQQGLKKVLNPRYLWGFGTGAVMANAFFGWNYGYGETGAMGFTVALAGASLLYMLSMLVLTELGSALPYAGGPYAFARSACGRTCGFLAGLASVLQYVFAAAVVTYSMGHYIYYLYPGVSGAAVAIIPVVLLALVQIVGVQHSARLQLIIAGCALSGYILYYMGGYYGHSIDFIVSPFKYADVTGVFMALPFVLWLFTGSEGLVMSAEETGQPGRCLKTGLLTTALTTLAVIAGVWFFSAGSPVHRRALAGTEYPLLLVLKTVQQSDHRLYHVYVLLGIVAYLACLNSIIHACSRQVFALARAGYLPPVFSKIHYFWRTPYQAIVLVSFLVIVLMYIVNLKLWLEMTAISFTIVHLINIASFLKIRLAEGSTGQAKTFPLYFAASVIGVLLLLTVLVSFGLYYPRALLYILLLYGIGVCIFAAVLRNNVVDDAPEEYSAESAVLQRKVTVNKGSGRW